MGLGNIWKILDNYVSWLICFAVTYFWKVFPFPQFFMRNNQWSQQTTHQVSDTKTDPPPPWWHQPAANHSPAFALMTNHKQGMITHDSDSILINIHSPPQNTSPPGHIITKITWWGWPVSRHLINNRSPESFLPASPPARSTRWASLNSAPSLLLVIWSLFDLLIGQAGGGVSAHCGVWTLSIMFNGC